jgi:hypothetical protein
MASMSATLGRCPAAAGFGLAASAGFGLGAAAGFAAAVASPVGAGADSAAPLACGLLSPAAPPLSVLRAAARISATDIFFFSAIPSHVLRQRLANARGNRPKPKLQLAEQFAQIQRKRQGWPFATVICDFFHEL